LLAVRALFLDDHTLAGVRVDDVGGVAGGGWSRAGAGDSGGVQGLVGPTAAGAGCAIEYLRGRANLNGAATLALLVGPYLVGRTGGDDVAGGRGKGGELQGKQTDNEIFHSELL